MTSWTAVPRGPLEYALLRAMFRTASDEALAHYCELLGAGGRRPARRTRRIALVGLRGAGKSTLGAAAAQRLGVPFIELAQEIEREAGMDDLRRILAERDGLYRQADAVVDTSRHPVPESLATLLELPPLRELLADNAVT